MHHFFKEWFEVVLKPTKKVNLISVQCWVSAGSIHENSNEKGMAHVLEHMLFKGSKKYGVGEISSTVEFCGGDMNAYTSFDRTVYFLTIS